MLINLTDLINKHGLKITGIIHIGAHYAEEHKIYLRNSINKIAYIEASEKTYTKLCRMNLQGEVVLYNVALADYEGTANLYAETANQGQSSSLLKPGTHLNHYPNIKFDHTEQVNVTTLDKLNLKGYNMLNIDVQGAELLVLKGGPKTLDNIDYIYIEVNKEAVYENCAMVDELDNFLEGFKRVDTIWTDQGWGDALYIRTGKRNMYTTPAMFRQPHPFPYPAQNKIEFERWFFDNLKIGEITSDRIYLPIFWTAYYVKNKYGKHKPGIMQLQVYLNRLPRNLKYFTIVQYDDGILNDLGNLDIIVFSMGGGRVDYPLPLIAEPLPKREPVEKDIMCSFVGRITHPIRQKLVDDLSKLNGFYISTRPHKTSEYTDILNRSKYVLCPRGYGVTSFRIQEAAQFGAVPVYISDKIISPHYQFEQGILLEPGPGNDYTTADGELLTILELVSAMDMSEPNTEKIKQWYQDYFTYESNKRLILQHVNK